MLPTSFEKSELEDDQILIQRGSRRIERFS